MSEASIITEFNVKFSYLRAHPDLNIITDLAEFSKRHISVAYHIVNAIVHRLSDPNTDSSFKLPILYLCDAIMKKVGGTYPEYFGRTIVLEVQRAMHELSLSDRKKLAVLIQTWEERRLMPADALVQMSAVAAAATTQALPQQYAPLPASHYSNNQLDTGFAPASADAFLPAPAHAPTYSSAVVGAVPVPGQTPYVSSIVPPVPYTSSSSSSSSSSASSSSSSSSTAGHKRPSRFAPPPASAGPPPLSLLQDLVQAEMSVLLGQLLNDLGGAQLTLAELQASNPALYDQLKQTAESQARIRYDAVAASAAGARISSGSSSSNGSGSGSSSSSRNGHSISGLPMSISMGLHSSVAAAGSSSTAGHKPPYPGTALSHAPSSGSSSQSVTGYICEVPVYVDLARAEAVDRSLMQMNIVKQEDGEGEGEGGDGDPTAAAADSKTSLSSSSSSSIASVLESAKAAAAGTTLAPSSQPTLAQKQAAALIVHTSLNALLFSVSSNKNLPLPSVLFGPIPLEPSAGFVASQGPTQHAARKQLKRVRFRPDELGRNANPALQALYIERSFRFEDGTRFKTQFQLNAYIDTYAQKRRAEMKIEQARSKPPNREWYWRISEWVSNTRAADQVKEEERASDKRARPEEEECIVPADEYFTRCPVSKEVFETIWNDNEGGFMYRHAARVLVTQLADKAVYKLSQPTENANVRYLIAHKLLVVNDWLSAGKCATLKDAIQRYEAMGKNRADIDKLREAAGVEDDDENIFVMIEHRV